MANLKSKTAQVMDYLQNHDGYAKIMDICTALDRNGRSIAGSINSLVKLELAERYEDVDGEETVKFVKLTDAGLAYAPTEDAE